MLTQTSCSGSVDSTRSIRSRCIPLDSHLEMTLSDRGQLRYNLRPPTMCTCVSSADDD